MHSRTRVAYIHSYTLIYTDAHVSTRKTATELLVVVFFLSSSSSFNFFYLFFSSVRDAILFAPCNRCISPLCPVQSFQFIIWSQSQHNPFSAPGGSATGYSNRNDVVHRLTNWNQCSLAAYTYTNALARIGCVFVCVLRLSGAYIRIVYEIASVRHTVAQHTNYQNINIISFYFLFLVYFFFIIFFLLFILQVCFSSILFFVFGIVIE